MRIGLVISFSLMLIGCTSYYRKQCDLYYRISDWKSAEQVLRKGLVTDPDNPEIYYLLGQIYGYWGRFTESDMAFQQSLSLSNRYKFEIDRYRDFFVQEQLNRGIELYNKGEYQEAIDALSQVETIRKDETRHFSYLGLCYSAMKNYERARHFLLSSAELNQDEVSILELARVNHILGDRQGILEFSERLLSRYPERAEVLAILAAAYEGEGMYSKAISMYREILWVDPRNQSARYNLAVLLCREGKPSEAIPVLEELSRLEPGNRRTRFTICSLLYDVGENEEALSCFQEYTAENPSDEQALEYLFVLNRKLSRWKDSQEIRAKLEQPDPPDSVRFEEEHEDPQPQ